MDKARVISPVGLLFVALSGLQTLAAGPATTQAVPGTAHATLVAFATTWRDLRDDAAMQLIAVRSPAEEKLVASFGRQIRAERMLRDAVIKRWGEAQRRFFEEQNLPSVAGYGVQLLEELEEEQVQVQGDSATFASIHGPQTLHRIDGRWRVVIDLPADADERDVMLHNGEVTAEMYENLARRLDAGDFADPAAMSREMWEPVKR